MDELLWDGPYLKEGIRHLAALDSQDKCIYIWNEDTRRWMERDMPPGLTREEMKAYVLMLVRMGD